MGKEKLFSMMISLVCILHVALIIISIASLFQIPNALERCGLIISWGEVPLMLIQNRPRGSSLVAKAF